MHDFLFGLLFRPEGESDVTPKRRYLSEIHNVTNQTPYLMENMDFTFYVLIHYNTKTTCDLRSYVFGTPDLLFRIILL